MTTQAPISVASTGASTGRDHLRRRALDALNRLPPFSPILSKLLASLAGQDVSFVVLGELIEKDTVVAGNILRVVNSAIYARRSGVNSIRHALSVLGIQKVRNTVLAMSISRMLNQSKTPPGWSMERFNSHSAAVAMMCDILAQHTRVEYPEGAFVAGLLHDVGQMLIAIGLPAEYEEIARLHGAGERSWKDCEQEVLGFDHAGLSADAMEKWKIPAPIRDAINGHHQAAGNPGSTLPLSAVLQAANAYVNGFGYSVRPEQPAIEGTEPMRNLGMPPDLIKRLTEQFQAEHSAIAKYFE